MQGSSPETLDRGFGKAEGGFSGVPMISIAGVGGLRGIPVIHGSYQTI